MKIMVIDDEPIVPKALRALIPWEEHGFEWLPPAENGEEGLELLLHNQPDLLLVDCQMPVMDGLQLLERIRSLQLPVKSIILSGHDEFVYAQQAIKLGASDYLLKPPDMDQLLKVVLQIKTELEEEKRLKNQIKDHLPLIRYRFVSSLLEGATMNDDSFLEKAEFLHIPLQAGPVVAAVLEVEEDPDFPKAYSYEDQQLINFAVMNISEETLARWQRRFILHASPQPNRFAVVMNVTENEKEPLRQDLNQLVDNLRDTLHYNVTIGVSMPGMSLNTDGKSVFTAAQTALEYKYYTGPNQVLFLEDLEWERTPAAGNRGGEETSAVPMESPLRLALKLGSPEQLQQWLHAFMTHLRESDYPVQVTKSVTLQHMVGAANVLMEMHPKLSLDELLPADRITLFFEAPTLEQLEGTVHRYIEGLLQHTLELRKSGKNAFVEKAKQFIAEHYHQSLTLESIAQHVYLSPVYLSFLFKQVEGVNLSDHLTEVRLEQAKRLLQQSSLKTYEVALRTGYQDEKYFSRLFKKKTSLTPTEFRNGLLKE